MGGVALIFILCCCLFNVVGGHNSSRLPTTALATIKDLDPEGDKNILIRIYTQNKKKKKM